MDLAGILEKNRDKFYWLLDPAFEPGSGMRINLGKENQELASMDFSTTKELENLIFDRLRLSGKKFAYGGYGENREFYKGSPLFLIDKARTIHLGIDFWLPAGSAIRLPLDGRVKSIKDNAGKGNYGPTLITEHMLDDQIFYLLSGHLSRSTLGLHRPGEVLNKGEIVGYLGNHEENGDWPPHLHFQIIHELKDNSGDYPGVAAVAESSWYLKNCPDPSIIFNLD